MMLPKVSNLEQVVLFLCVTLEQEKHVVNLSWYQWFVLTQC